MDKQRTKKLRELESRIKDVLGDISKLASSCSIILKNSDNKKTKKPIKTIRKIIRKLDMENELYQKQRFEILRIDEQRKNND